MGNKKICKVKDHNFRSPGIVATAATFKLHPNRSTQTGLENKEITKLQFHIPAGILAKIVSYVGAGGTYYLKNWIRAGPEGKAAVYSKETLSRVRLTFVGHPDYMLWSKQESPYFKFFSKCLEHKNPQALYVESIRLAFCAGDLEGATNISRTIKNAFATASLLHIMLCSFSGEFDMSAFSKFKSEHHVLSEVRDIVETLLFHVNCMEPRRQNTYADTWRFQYIPGCFLDHDWIKEDNGNDVCYVSISIYPGNYVCLHSICTSRPNMGCFVIDKELYKNFEDVLKCYYMDGM